MKNGTENKLKFKQLQRRLNLALWQARGLLDTLWNFGGVNCPRGDIGRFTDEEIAAGLDWRDNPQELLQTLVSVRWCDENARHRILIHDWYDHCEEGVHKALARTISVFATGHLPSLSRFTKLERGKLIKQYELKYGREEVKNGIISACVLERFETLKNAPAMPSLAMPSLAQPTNQPPPSANGNGSAGGRVGFVAATWHEVETRLASLGVSEFPKAVSKAKELGCTPEHGMKLIDVALTNGYGAGAICLRFYKANPALPIDEGWPVEPPKVQAAVAERNLEDVRGLIIRDGKQAGWPDEKINAALSAEGCELL